MSPRKKKRPQNVGELRESGYKVSTIREELRKNLITKLKSGDRLFPNIFGYDETVIPQITNAILAGQDIVFLGERGQAKSRIIRSLIDFLDEEYPVLAGCEIPEDPYDPITLQGKNLILENGDSSEIRWMSRDERYSEKLATPDITIADLIGEVDPIKVAEGRYLSDELTIHYGQIPRINHGIFCINELPDLAERIQVGLLNIMEERDVQIRGHRVRLPLDVFVVASANPEDYTNRGRIITPLKDRYGAQVRTHYPQSVQHELDIVELEKLPAPKDFNVHVPAFMNEIIIEITKQARKSPDVNQRSGVSVRTSIANYESIVANALRRALSHKEKEVIPRISDLPYIIPSTSGKVEFETIEDCQEEEIITKLVENATVTVFNRFFNIPELEEIVTRFQSGVSIEVGESIASKEYTKIVKQISDLKAPIEKLEMTGAGNVASAVEFIFEGLHLNKRLNKDHVGSKMLYRT